MNPLVPLERLGRAVLLALAAIGRITRFALGAASHILRAQITRFGSLCVLNGELVDLRAEVATAAASSRGTCEEEGFLQMSEEVATILVKKSRG